MSETVLDKAQLFENKKSHSAEMWVNNPHSVTLFIAALYSTEYPTEGHTLSSYISENHSLFQNFSVDFKRNFKIVENQSEGPWSTN